MSPPDPVDDADDRMEGVILVLTERCNSRCGMCEYWKARPPRLLSADAIESFWNRRMLRRPRFVTLSGGEPLLHPELFRIADFLRGRADHMVLSTNGLRLTAHAGPVAARFDKIILSLDGATPAVYKRIRGVNGFQAVMDSARALKFHRPSATVVLKMTIQKSNFRDLPEWFRLAAKMGADGAALAVPDLTSDAFFAPGSDRREPAGRLLLTASEADEFERIVDRILAGHETPVRDGFIIEGNLRAFVDFFRRSAAAGTGSPEEIPARNCRMARTRLILNADGSIRPCFFLPPLGHIGDPGKDDIFHSEPFRSFRRQMASESPPPCRTCYQFLDWRFQ